jgi:hypothetical protein
MLTLIHEALAAGSLEDRLYFVGYKGVCPSRGLRRFIARSRWHRAWLSGYMGRYEEDGKAFGVCDRDWYQYRDRSARSSAASKVLLVIFHPHLPIA